MKKTKNRLILVIILGIVFTSLLIGTIAVISFKLVTNDNNNQILLQQCKESAESMNVRFSEVENLVNTMAYYYLDGLESASRLGDKEYLDGYIDETKMLAYSIVQNNRSVVSTYYRFNPELTSPTAGFFISRKSTTGKPSFITPTDLSKYRPDDTEHVGWYYKPIANGGATWIPLYNNLNNNIYMISYVKALYKDGTLVGVVGIDVDFDVICDQVGDISLYDSGYAILMDDNGDILYSGDHSPELSDNVKNEILNNKNEYVRSSYMEKQLLYITMSHEIRNGEYLVLIVPEREIYWPRDRMIFSIILIAIAVSTFMILVLTGLINHIIGNTHTDRLTGANNRNAYQERINVLESSIRSGMKVSYSIVVCDINCLKIVNDNIGHAEGDRLIVSGYELLSSFFAGEDIYRIGGDEFVIILENRTKTMVEKRVEEFQKIMAERSVNYMEHPLQVVISSGVAVYDGDMDDSCEDTFNRADRKMYENKDEFYKINPTLKRRS